MVTMEMLKRKQSLEEEINLCQVMISFEHRTDMKNKLQKYMDQVERELLDFLR